MPSTQAFPAVKECDIRGRCPGEVDEALFSRVARNFGTAICSTRFGGLRDGTVVLGGDGRSSTAALRRTIADGLLERGAAVTELPGAVPTPVVYWAKRRLRAQACAIVTASHSPPDWNGLKVMNGPLPPLPAEILALVAPPDETREPRCAGTHSRAATILDEYLREQSSTFARRGITGLSVVVDPGGGCQAGVATRLLRAVGARVTAIHDALDGTFADRHPDCAVPEHLHALAAAVRRHRADVGIAFDGDGDRLAVVDDLGRVASAEQVAMLLLQGPVPVPAGGTVILDVKSSMHVEELVRRTGGVPIRCRSGHAFMKRAVITGRAVLGAEVTGHLFLGALEGIDDPLHTALLLCEWRAGSGQPLSASLDALPRLSVSPDVRIRMSADGVAALVDACLTRFHGCEIDRTDGVRLVWPEGWLLVRRSVTEEACTLRFEGREPADLGRVVRRFVDAFPDLRDAVPAALARRGH